MSRFYYYYLFKDAVLVFCLLMFQQNLNAACLKVAEYSILSSDELSLATPLENSDKLEQEIESYYSLIEESMHHRIKSLELYEKLTQELKQDDHLSAASLVDFKQSIKAHLDLRNRLYQVARSRECWLRERYSALEPKLRLKGIMLSLSAALTLYDNYLLVVAMFQQNDQLRHIIDQPDKGFGLSSNHLMDASLAFHSMFNREKVKYAIKYYQKNINLFYLKGNKNNRFPIAKQNNNKIRKLTKSDIAYLNLLIEQSPSFQMLQKNSSLSFLKKKIKFYSIATTDSLSRLEKEGVNLMSLVFGNTIGLIESRKGKLYQQSKVEKNLLNSLQAGDILLEKTPFRLTDQFIPGYWGHAAIWIGNEQELKQLDLWEHPVVRPWHKKIRAGHSIVEALRSGVELDLLSTFLNIDDMVILRDKSMTKQQLREVIVNAFRQLGKAYDFNFDISTSDRIICSELVYISYLHIEWPTKKTLGRFTISPDHIAEKIKTQNKKLSIIKLYLNGKLIPANLNQQLFLTLLE
jgi:uncharacterized protein YycO